MGKRVYPKKWVRPSTKPETAAPENKPKSAYRKHATTPSMSRTHHWSAWGGVQNTEEVPSSTKRPETPGNTTQAARRRSRTATRGHLKSVRIHESDEAETSVKFPTQKRALLSIFLRVLPHGRRDAAGPALHEPGADHGGGAEGLRRGWQPPDGPGTRA